jgi:SAM-dependent methyltransferase
MTTTTAPEETITALLDRFRAAWGKVKLDVGCGGHPRGEDHITVDRYAGAEVPTPGAPTPIKADIQADMWEIPVPAGSVDEIWCAHALEHAPMAKVPEVLREFLRILRPGGRAIIQVPNFDYVAKYWLTGADRSWAERLVFGQQFHAGEFHKSAFTAGVLRADLEGVGFTVLRVEIRWTHSQETLQAVCVKPGAA